MAAALTLSPALATAASDPSGVWLDDKGRGAIEIKPCGDRMCGYVVWVKDTNDQRGCGKQILGDVSSAGSDTWDNGWIYSPEKQKKYSVELKRLSDEQLRVKGYAGTKYFSKTMVWTKAPADLGRCDVAQLDSGAQPQQAPQQGQAGQSGTNAELPAIKPAPAQSAAQQPKSEAPQPDRIPVKPQETAKAAPAPQPQAQPQEQAKAAPQPQPEPQQEADNVPLEEGPDLSDLPIDKYFNKTADGRCKLDLPWVKLDFDCSKKE